MPWSIDHFSKRGTEKLDAWFAMAGKCLYLANSFEMKCKHLIRLIRLADVLKIESGLDAALTLCNQIQDKMLGGTISEMSGSSLVSEEDLQRLRKAKDARNFIAHEGASIGHLSGITVRALKSQTSRLRQEVATLAAGDNLVSRWLYEIEENRVAPSTITQDYAAWIDDWIFGTYENVHEEDVATSLAGGSLGSVSRGSGS